MTQATFVILAAAAALFAYRLCVGPVARRPRRRPQRPRPRRHGRHRHPRRPHRRRLVPARRSSPSRSSDPIGNGMIARFIEGRQS